MTIASDPGPAPQEAHAVEAAPRDESLIDTRYRAYERVFAALSLAGDGDEAPLSPTEMSYRQHAVIETLRDLELSRRRFLLLQRQEQEDEAAAAPDRAAS